ncbi:hypothetical protein HanXRQr2_Chr04g0191861 [Helianthus annuus]|uniref:Uncharacterized protein n=1 Tax=Helianthus annuus TaxID=4232 RepID=A0A9K3JCB0_HELAN|nr:hypothetical protein HanXRQr2_Chr04g0191861 [Helianthus annuus]
MYVCIQTHPHIHRQLDTLHTYITSIKRTKKMVQKFEICINILKMGVEFVMVFLEDMKIAIHQTNNQQSISSTSQTPYIGLLP